MSIVKQISTLSLFILSSNAFSFTLEAFAEDSAKELGWPIGEKLEVDPNSNATMPLG